MDMIGAKIAVPDTLSTVQGRGHVGRTGRNASESDEVIYF
jgi:hypothetical protein